MAKLHEEIVVIKVSKMVRDNETSVDPLLTDDTLSSLEEVVQQLAGTNALVEIQVA